MTMNYTSYSTFPASSIRADDDFMISSISSARGNPCRSNRGIHHEAFENREGRDWGEGCSSDSSHDIASLLPADPFGMDLSSTLSAAAVLFMRDLGANSNFYYEDALDDWVDEELLELSMRETSTPEVSSYPEGLVFALAHLGVKDLLSVEGVCTSLRSAIRGDPLLWRCIHIDSPLNERITDEALLRLTQKARGEMECLSLVDCSKITDDGLRLVLETNPKLEKLSVSGCRRLSIEGLINNLRAFKSSGLTGIKHLKLGRLFSLLPEHYEELQLLLGTENLGGQPNAWKPQFFHCGVSSLACDDDRAIDIEMCPECQKLKYVYDCPSESCQEKGPDHCRACDSCITRCSQCGRCVKDRRYIENFFLDVICRDCLEAQNQERMGE